MEPHRPDVADTDGDGTSDDQEDRTQIGWSTSASSGWDSIRAQRTPIATAFRDGAEDRDHDLLSNAGEQRYGTDPRDADSDNDGIDDWHDDSDGDGVKDGLTQDATPLPAGAIPTLAHLRDRPESYRACHRVDGQSRPKVCVIGQRGPKVVLVRRLARAAMAGPAGAHRQGQGLAAVPRDQVSCPVAQVAGVGPDCVRWRKLAFAKIARSTRR